jgi:UDP-N-acetylmuramoyl-tripeptide--D-alanyl-D-alanine ligase
MIAVRIGLSKHEIIAGLTQYVPTDLRLQMKRSGFCQVIDDSYNASPDSMESAIKTLVKIPGGARKVAILGDMFEMGDQEESAHRRVGRYLSEQDSVRVALLVGTRARWMYEEAKKNAAMECHYFETTDELEKKVFDIIRKDDIILVKASRGMHLDQVSTYILNRE